jgi:hypothetical protein
MSIRVPKTYTKRCGCVCKHEDKTLRDIEDRAGYYGICSHGVSDIPYMAVVRQQTDPSHHQEYPSDRHFDFIGEEDPVVVLKQIADGKRHASLEEVEELFKKTRWG